MIAHVGRVMARGTKSVKLSDWNVVPSAFARAALSFNPLTLVMTAVCVLNSFSPAAISRRYSARSLHPNLESLLPVHFPKPNRA